VTSRQPARTAARRAQPTVYRARRRRVLLGAVLALLLAATGRDLVQLVGTALAGAGHPLNGKAHPLNDEGRTSLSAVRWPQQGQAALVLGNGRPAARQIVSMASATLPVAGTLTNYDPLIPKGYAGKTSSDSAAGGCLAFFTRVTVGGRRLTAVGVVLGQGQAATRWCSSPLRARPPSSWSSPSPRRSVCARLPRPARVAQEETLADTALRCCLLAVAPPRSLDVNTMTTRRRTRE
jgi:hypothetical protein